MTEPQHSKSSTRKMVGIVVTVFIIGIFFFYFPALTYKIPAFNEPTGATVLTETTSQPSTTLITKQAPDSGSSTTPSSMPKTSATTAPITTLTTSTQDSSQTSTFIVSSTTLTPPPSPAPTAKPQLQIFCDGSALSGRNVTTPEAKLVEFSLKLINKDRASAGIPPVKLNPKLIAQEHADNMLKNAYVSHWDPSGLKPYMRYTLLCGHHANSENVAAYFGSPVPDPYQALTELEFQMVHNDTAQQNAHRDTILGLNFEQVQIGVAYDPGNAIYLVHEFETGYINWTGTPPVLSRPSQSITLAGNFTSSQLTMESISIYYDPLPTPKTPLQLMNSPYDDGYDLGNYIGSVTQPGFIATKGVTIVASTWNQTGTSFVVSFALDRAHKVKGDGIYTLYLFVSNGKSYPFSITNASIRIT